MRRRINPSTVFSVFCFFFTFLFRFNFRLTSFPLIQIPPNPLTFIFFFWKKHISQVFLLNSSTTPHLPPQPFLNTPQPLSLPSRKKGETVKKKPRTIFPNKTVAQGRRRDGRERLGQKCLI